MNHKKIIAAAMALCTAFGGFSMTAGAASYIIESFDNTKEIECLVYQPYPDAGKLVISINEDMRTFVTVKQLSEEKEYFLFYDAVLDEGETTYTMPLECGKYEITIGVPFAKNSSKIMEYTETVNIENPDFNLDLNSSAYHYTLWRTEEERDSVTLLQEQNSDTNTGDVCIYRALEFQQTSYIKGDINSDGVVDIADAGGVLNVYAKNAAGLSVDGYTKEELASADVDESTVIDISDASFILTYYARNAAGIDSDWESVIG